jgi:broad specificity phosphatase PhoE
MAALAQGKTPMTTYTSDQQAQRLAEIDFRTREAWADYTEELRELEGRDYEEAEDESWDRLQKRLKELDGERQLVEGT